MPLLSQRCRPSSRKTARRMALKLKMRKMVKKHGMTLVKVVPKEVSHEEKVQHDVLGCSDCYVDPHNGHMTYCPLSVYNPFHPSHMCLAGAPCSFDRYLADLE